MGNEHVTAESPMSMWNAVHGMPSRVNYRFLCPDTTHIPSSLLPALLFPQVRSKYELFEPEYQGYSTHGAMAEYGPLTGF
jgi:hypothetical protein